MKKVCKFLKDNTWFIIFFLLFVVTVLYSTYRCNYIFNNYYTPTAYQINYSNGFISRGLVGTLLKMFFRNVTYKKIIGVVITSTMICFTTVSYLLQIIIKKMKNDKRIVVLCFLFVFNSVSFLYMFKNGQAGRYDYFLFLNAIITLIIINKNKYLWIVPIITLMSMLIHENYLFYYAPMICLLLCFNAYENKDKKSFKYGLLNFIVLCAIFFLIFFFGKNTGFNNYIEHTAYLQQYTDFEVSSVLVHDVYYWPLASIAKFVRTQMAPSYGIVNYTYAIVSFGLYFFALLKIIFIPVYKKIHNKLVYVLLILSCFATLVLFFIGSDYGRWVTSITNCITMLAFFMCYKYSDVVIKSFDKKYVKWLIPLIIFFILMFQTSEEFVFLTYDKINIVVDFLKSIF